METFFGISLGTASAAIAANKGGKVEMLANHLGERATPTLVAYCDNETMIGRSAKQALHRNAKNTASHMAILIGKDFNEADVQSITSSVMCEVGRGEGGKVCYVVQKEGKQKSVSVSETLTHVLKSLYETAGSFCSSSAEERAMVLAVPANCTAVQKNAIRECAVKAGFQVMRIISEPSAVCLAHGIGQTSRKEKSYALVYNLGAHSLTLTLLLVTGGMYCEVVTRCIRDVGGRECDSVIADLLTSEFERQWKVSIRDNKRTRFKLLAAAESAKRALSTVDTTSLHLESLHDGVDFTYSLSRGRFEGMCSSIFRRCVEPLSALLAEAGITTTQLEHVVFAGGSCKIPYIQQLLGKEFPSSEIHLSPPPDEAIATGCALQAAVMGGRWEGGRAGGGEEDWGRVEMKCVPQDLWIMGGDLEGPGQLLLPSLTPIPCQRSLTLTLSLSKANHDKACLEVWEKSTNQEREIAKIFVPVDDGEGVEGDSCEGVRVKVMILWAVDNAITIATEKLDSKWLCSVPLACEARD